MWTDSAEALSGMILVEVQKLSGVYYIVWTYRNIAVEAAVGLLKFPGICGRFARSRFFPTKVTMELKQRRSNENGKEAIGLD